MGPDPHDIAAFRGPAPGDWRLAALAGRQHGVVTAAQLTCLGVRRGAVAARLQSGRLHRLHPGVYAVGHAALSTEARYLAAVCAGGPGAALSHRSAAAWWGLLRAQPGAGVDVTTPRRSRKPAAGLVLHRTRRLAGDEVTRRAGVPVTSVARTLLDLADRVTPRQLERCVHEAAVLRILAPEEPSNVLARANGRRGAATLRALLEEPPAPTRSVLEDRFLALCRDSGLPPPEVGAHRAGMEVDFLWPSDWLVVEVDGFAFHGTRAAFERDRRRDAALARAGHRVARFSWPQVTASPEEVSATVKALLSSSPAIRLP